MVPTSDSRNFLAAVRDASLHYEFFGPLVSAARKRTSVYIVASPRHQVGKTFLARLLCDFLRLEGRSICGFDVAPGDDALKDYLPAVAPIADIAETPSHVALFDRLIVDDGIVKVVDLGGAAYQRFFSIVEEIGFVAEARRRTIELTILFAADAHPASAAAYADLQRRLPDTVVVPVFNDAITLGRLLREQFPAQRAAAVPLQIPFLAPALKVEADRLPYAFAYVHDRLPPQLPAAIAVELRFWTRRTFLEFRELQLRLLLEELRASLAR